jgi:hypothetical protein
VCLDIALLNDVALTLRIGMKLTRLGGLSLTQDQIMTLGKSMGNKDNFVEAYSTVKKAVRPLGRALLYTIDIYGVGYYFVTTQVALHEFGDKRLHDPIAEGKYEVPIRELMRQHGVDDIKFITIIQQYRVSAMILIPQSGLLSLISGGLIEEVYNDTEMVLSVAALNITSQLSPT